MTRLVMTNSRFLDKLKKLREERNIPQRELAYLLNVDTPMYSRLERGERKVKREQVITLSKFYNDDNLLTLWAAEKVYNVLAEEEEPQKVLSIVTEQFIEYGKY